MHKTTQSGDLKQLVDAVLKYYVGSSHIVKITHMEGEKIFGSCKQKANLALELKGDSHKHNHVNFFHPHVDHLIVRSNVEIEQLGLDQIHGNVEVLEAPCEDGV